LVRSALFARVPRADARSVRGEYARLFCTVRRLQKMAFFRIKIFEKPLSIQRDLCYNIKWDLSEIFENKYFQRREIWNVNLPK